ncbi:multidrug resistance-associated protein 1 isoform X1 [Danio rerio]|uniref:ABC-type glutathione-S-conjugate transporter n=2 Tax=Danio rerio TaxID=7955 RepID=A0A140LGU2_DANRE|nr:multidrug resistance-associated protein 1-like isoform X1 [Danio rerio]|eukprot:XP_003198194.2 multidrug resistance-associated protein 1-like isoform X1 [Danio rerio]
MDTLCSLSGLDPLWDWNVTWYTEHPDLTKCFQHTILVWFPCFYLWICAPFYCLYLKFYYNGRISISSLCCAKMGLALCLASIGFLETVYLLVERSRDIEHLMVFLLSPIIRSLTMILVMLMIHLERLRGFRSSVFLFLFWMLSVVCSLVPLRANIQANIKEGFSADPMRFAAFFTFFSLQLAQLILSCFADQRPDTLKPVYVKNPCPVEDASFLSKLLFWWYGRLVVKGYRSPLKAEDLWSLREEDTSEKIICDLEKEWAKQWAKLQQKKSSLNEAQTLGFKLSSCVKQLFRKLFKEQCTGFVLFRTLAKIFSPYFLTGTLFLVIQDALMFSIPQVLSLLLGYVRDEDAPLWKGYLFAFSLFLLSCLQSLFNHQYMYTCLTVGMRVKTAVMGLVYRKSLVINSAARKTCTVGEIVNLVSADTQKLVDFVMYFNALWLAPIEIALCLFFLWQHLGPSTLAGITTVILIFPLNGFIAKMRSKLQEVQMKHKDERIKLMNEILSGIKILKFYAWEKAFRERVLGYREKELNALKKSQILYSVSIASFNSSTLLIAFAMFGVYVLIDDKHVLDAQKIFVSMALINILKAPLSQLPIAMSTTMQVVVSLKRLGTFLDQDELKLDSVQRVPYNPNIESVVINNGTFSWSKDSTPCLRRINVKVQRGSLVAVVGHVGSGKSSLLSAMLGEMEKKSGHITITGSVGYVPQQAWIQNATLKDNILFGCEKKDSLYQKVLEACALLPDLEILPARDATEIGEKGLNLSGGQKQRVSLARAVYRNSDIYLLDDPLSAVDAHVGQHIFEKVIGPNGSLKNKTRVLVTHGLSFLPQADLILVMADGEIKEMGSYAELLSRKNAFAELKAFSVSERKESATLKGTRKSVSFLSIKDFSTDLIRGDLGSASIQTMEAISDPKLNQDRDEVGRLTQADKAHTGRVKLEMYVEYFRTIGLAFIIPIIFLYAFQQVASLAYNYWLSLWADDPVINGTQVNTDLKLGVYGALGFAQGIAIFGTTVAISLGGIIASRQLHLDLLNNVLHSPMSFFESTPSGNLLNRFSKEIDAIDCMIPHGLKIMLGYVFKLLEVCIIVLMATPFAGVIILPLTLLYAFIQSFYVATSCQLRRLESVSRSPIYTHFNETVQGASVIRAFGEQPRFILQANCRVDLNQTSYFPRFVASRWLAVNLEFLGNLLVLAAAILSVMGRATLSPGTVGLAVSHSLQVTGILSWIVRSWTDVENNIVSVERVKEYAETAKEAPWTFEDSPLPSDWPRSGSIGFQAYGLQYRKGLDWALKEISLSVNEREKVGIVGRTGAGKSSLALGIFRILEAAKGKIFIDGINIAEIGLHELRSRITIIPQDPVLFSGSLRINLDPFDRYTDEEVWRSLELAHLKTFVSDLPDKLNHECSEGGENLSLGQRQLICLARALLRKTKILVLDEATAAVDLKTDNLIQSTIRTQFEDCTVLTIAHRLNTIMDYTRVIVMDRGNITEIDSPSNLISQHGQFYRMCREAGLV